MIHLTALGLSGHYDEAYAALDDMEKKYPERKEELLFKRAVFYDREGQWEKLYETLRKYSLRASQPRLQVSLMKINALMRLDLGMYALLVADRAEEIFRGAPDVYQIKAAVLLAHQLPEEALFILQKVEDYYRLPIVVELLLGTERYSEASRFRHLFAGRNAEPWLGKKQAVLLPPAELTVDGRWGAPFKDDEMAREAGIFSARAEAADSPFTSGLSRMMAQWFAERGAGQTSDPARWLAVGRDKEEQGIALAKLTMLLIRRERYGEAEKTARQSVELLPGSSIMWRVLIALNGGRMEDIKKAREMCPAEPEIWLGSIVAETRQADDRLKKEERIATKSHKKSRKVQQWAEDEIEAAIEGKTYSVGTIVRAGDFMLRNNMIDTARMASEYAMRNCRGLLPAYILGLRCAVAERDERFALLCTQGAVRSAVDPWPFFKLIAEIEIGTLNTDAGTVKILEELKNKFPDEARWARHLGNICLINNKPERALGVLELLIADHPDNIDLRTMLLTAEAARRAGQVEKSVKILERARKMYPSNRVVLNNLVYSLALDGKTIARAQELLPKLLEMWGDSFVVFDTAAVVYLNSGQTRKAKEYLTKAMGLVDQNAPMWIKQNPTAVDIDVYLGQFDYSVDRGLSELQKQARKRFRKDVYPAAKKLADKFEERKGK